MKKLPIIICFFISSLTLYSQQPVIKNIFMQGNNINTVFRTDGVFNCDKVSFPSWRAGFVWPSSSITRMTMDFASGIWIAAKVGPQHEIRTAVSEYNSVFTPGNIPFIGQVPPASVCSDTLWKGYLVNLTDLTLVNGGTRIKTAGGRPYSITYDSWSNWPASRGAPYVEVNGMAGYQPGWNSDRPGIGNSNSRPDELCFMVYMDYTACTNNLHNAEIALPGGTLPMGAEVQQISFMFNCNNLQNMYFIKWNIINKSNLIWDSTYFALANDIDLGDATDDAQGCDSVRNLSFEYNFDNYDYFYESNPPALGTRILQGPLTYTGNPIDTVKLPNKTLVGYKMVAMAANIDFCNCNDGCRSDPDIPIMAFNFMRGFTGCGAPIMNYATGRTTHYMYNGDACSRTGWYDSIPAEKRYLQSTGPFTMNSGDTQTIVMAFVIGSGSNNFQNVCNVQTLSDSARKYYYSDFPVCFPIGIEQTSSQVPDRFALYQNYPNPFNPATKIRFSIPPSKGVRGMTVQLNIYDALGRLVTTIFNQPLVLGTYEVEFDGTNYPSGVYFYKITANDFSESKKMILMK